MSLGGEIVGVIFVNVQVVGLDLTDNGDMRGFFKVPKLETGHFINHNRGRFKLIEDFDRWRADVADKIGVFARSVQQSFDERAGCAFAFGRGDADNGAGAVVEKVAGQGGFIVEFQRWDRGAAENYIIGRIIFVGEFGRSEVLENVELGVFKFSFKVFFGGLAFFAVAE